jgi:TctA family transporter
MAKAASIRSAILVPIIVVFIAMGSYTASNSMGDLVITLIFGVIGYFMKVYSYPKAPFVLGLVLGRIAEGNFNLSYDLYGFGFMVRPITFVIFLMVLWALIGPIIKQHKGKREEAKA